MGNTQLPAEVVEEIKLKAEDYANKHINGRSKPYEWGIVFNANKAGATEYATKLHQAQEEIESLTNQLKNYGKVSDENMKLLRQENERLQQWKAEASAILNPILDYGQSKEADIPLGASVTSVVLERCKKYKEAIDLLGIFIKRHETGLLPDRFIYNDIKSFLDGQK